MGEGLAVADAWNHRVLIWHKVPQDNNVPADLVIGQTDFTTGLANRGADHPELKQFTGHMVFSTTTANCSLLTRAIEEY